MVEDIPLGPINVAVLIAQGVVNKIVTATSADDIRNVATHTDKLFDGLGITRKLFTIALLSNLNIDKNRSTLSVGGFKEIDAPFTKASLKYYECFYVIWLH